MQIQPLVDLLRPTFSFSFYHGGSHEHVSSPFKDTYGFFTTCLALPEFQAFKTKQASRPFPKCSFHFQIMPFCSTFLIYLSW